MTLLDLDVDLDFGPESNSATPQEPQDYANVPLEMLWRLHEEYAEAAKREYAEKGRIEQELARRAHELRPDFEPETGGSVEIAGEELVIAMTYDRTYAYDEEKLIALGAMPEITVAEYGKLVKYEPKVNGTTYNSLLKRGGKLAEALNALRSLKSARPTFAPKERVA